MSDYVCRGLLGECTNCVWPACEPSRDHIVYKIGEGLSTFYAKHERDVPKPNYPVPAMIGETFIVKDTVAIYHTNRDNKVIEMVWWKD